MVVSSKKNKDADDAAKGVAMGLSLCGCCCGFWPIRKPIEGIVGAGLEVVNAARRSLAKGKVDRKKQGLDGMARKMESTNETDTKQSVKQGLDKL